MSAARPAPRALPPQPADPVLLDAVRQRVHAASGLAITRDAAARALRQRLARRGLAAESYLAALTPAELQQLLELLVVPESWLFRDAGAFALAVRAVQARLAAGQGPVRLLVAPCAAGEEAYSLAIALTEAGLTPPQWHLDAVDLSTACLTRARAGWYSAHAFRGPERAFRERHFQPDGHGWIIDPALRQGIHFHQGNLLALAAPPGGYDIVFCRNLLIYFDAATTAAALARLRALLAPHGILCAGYAEVPAFCQGGFAALPVPGAFAVRHADAPVPDWLLPAGTEPRAPACPPGPVQPAASRVRAARPRAPAAAPATAPATAPRPPIVSSVADANAAAATATAASASEHRGRASSAASAGAPASASSAASAAAPGTAGSADSAGAPASSAASAGAPLTAGGVRGPAELLRAAHAAADRGDLSAAAALCQQVLAMAPDTADAYYLLAMASPAQPAAARAELRRCLYLQPDHYPALCQLALLADEDGDAAGAARLRRRAARVHARQETP